MKKFYTIILLLFAFISLLAQTTKEEMLANLDKCSGLYMTYPGPINTNYSKPPKGYKPFYISHYGRHGSRWGLEAKEYDYVQDIFADAIKNNALTEQGKEVKKIVDAICDDAKGRYGELTELGNQQHKEIAYRMYHNFPRIFRGKKYIESRASTIQRCIISMAAFDESLKECNHKLTFTRECGQRYQQYIANWDKWFDGDYMTYYKSFNDSISNFAMRHYSPDRLMNSLFSDQVYYNTHIKQNAMQLMQKLYNLQIDIKDAGLDVSLISYFTPDEMFYLWQTENIRNYYDYGPIPLSTQLLSCQTNLINNIIESADNAIADGKPAATLRFGHDCIVSPLATFFGLENCTTPKSDKLDDLYKYWTDYKVIPMGANLQLIFFSKKHSDDILVKILFNENETLITDLKSDVMPYYHWRDLKNYLNNKIQRYN